MPFNPATLWHMLPDSNTESGLQLYAIGLEEPSRTEMSVRTVFCKPVPFS